LETLQKEGEIEIYTQDPSPNSLIIDEPDDECPSYTYIVTGMYEKTKPNLTFRVTDRHITLAETCTQFKIDQIF
jgi:hypothetical protein